MSILKQSYLLDLSACLAHLVAIQKLVAAKQCRRVVVPLSVIHALDAMKGDPYARDAIKYFDSQSAKGTSASSISDSSCLHLQRDNEYAPRTPGGVLIDDAMREFSRRDALLTKSLAYYLVNPSCPDESWVVLMASDHADDDARRREQRLAAVIPALFPGVQVSFALDTAAITRQ